MIHLDTHVVVWLAGGRSDLLSVRARTLIDSEPLAISPMVEVELALLSEIGRIKDNAMGVVGELRRSLGLATATATFAEAAALAATSHYNFTRDPFDRLIGAHADAVGVRLITKDRVLRENLDFAIWD